MKKLFLVLAFAAFACAAPFQAYAGQDDCKDGEQWNEETQKCEMKDG